MREINVKRFEWSSHPSNIPWMRAKCCNSRINHQLKVYKLENPNIYGAYKPETQTVLTHEAEYGCKCGKTVIVVEGNVTDGIIHGCFYTDLSGSNKMKSEQKEV